MDEETMGEKKTTERDGIRVGFPVHTYCRSDVNGKFIL